jgi:RNA-binding protein 23/39
MRFFEKAGPVKNVQIVRDRVSGRSKGWVIHNGSSDQTWTNTRIRVGYVEFRSDESVQPAIQLTGQKLLGIPVIVQLTEAKKNRQARNTEGNGNAHANGAPFQRLYVGNIHFSIDDVDLHNIFEPFGELDFVQLQKDENGRSRGYGFVQ